MEQTVTLIQSVGHTSELFGQELGRGQQHVDEMTRQGWQLICIKSLISPNTPILMSWRRGA